MNSIERHQKLIIQKLSITNVEDKENIDIYQDLPLRKKSDLEAMEKKLVHDGTYRSQMVSRTLLFQSL